MKKLFSIYAVLLIAACANMYAQNASALLIPTDPVSLSMGRSGESTSMLVQRDNSLGVSLSYGMWAPKSADNNLMGLDASYKFLDRFAVSVEAAYLSDRTPSRGTSTTGAPTGEMLPTDLVVDAGVAFLIIPGVSVGVDAKMLRTSLTKGLEESVFAAGVSASYAGDSFFAGLSAHNILSDAALVRVEGGYSFSGLSAEAEADYIFDGAFMASAGLEYGFKDMAFVRAGYHYGSGNLAVPSFASVGLGFKIIGISLNATYLLASDTLSGTMLFGLGYSF